MLVVLVICLIGLVAGSGFGIFFSGEDNGTGQTIRTAIAQINQEYQEKLEKIQASHTFDTLEITGSQAVWKEVLATYAVKTTTDPEGQEVASMDNEKLGLLRGDFGVWILPHSIILCFLPLLAFVQSPEPAARPFQQLVESALLHHAAILHHQNAVGVLHRGEPMGHNHCGTARQQLVQGVLDFLFHLGI